MANLPTLGRPSDLLRVVKVWQRRLGPSVRKAVTPTIPWNLRATGKVNGILVEWEPTAGATGYILVRSDNTDFSTATAPVVLTGQPQNAYFDSIGTPAASQSYKIQAVVDDGHGGQVLGKFSGIVTATTTAVGDPPTPPTHDTTTTDDDQTGKGAYIL